MLILSMFLDQKSSEYFPRKTLFNFTNFRVNFEYVFLEKYLHDFRYKNMFRISIPLAFDFT
jgi:hypothetical protein